MLQIAYIYISSLDPHLHAEQLALKTFLPLPGPACDRIPESHTSSLLIIRRWMPSCHPAENKATLHSARSEEAGLHEEEVTVGPTSERCTDLELINQSQSPHTGMDWGH